MTFWQFLNDSPWIAFFIVCSTYYLIKGFYRVIMVSFGGWPPAHLDADGDFKSKEENQ